MNIRYLFTLLIAIVAFSSCDPDNFTDPNDPRFGSLVDTTTTTGDAEPPFETSNAKTTVRLNLSDTKDISPQIFGINNDWRRITNGNYGTFQNQLENLNYKLIRYPGGFESEFYDWSENLTPNWPNRPAVPGATIETVKATNPDAISIVLPINPAMLETLFSSRWDAAVADILNETKDAIDMTGPENILSIELGNEWWLQFSGAGVGRAAKLTKYSEIAKRMARYIRTEYPNANFNLLVNGDWTEPDEFSVIRDIFGDDIDDIDGLTLHTYAGYDSDSHDIRDMQDKVDACQANLGKTYLSLSEWAPSKLYNQNKIYAEGANLVVEHNYEHALTEADEAAFWPPTNPGIPGLGLFNFQLNLVYPTAQLFGDMAQDFSGKVIAVTDGTVRGAAAQREDDTIVAYITGKQVPFTTVTLNVGEEVGEIISTSLWEPGNLSDTAEAIPMVETTGVDVFVNGQNITFNVNKDSAYTIYKVIFRLAN